MTCSRSGPRSKVRAIYWSKNGAFFEVDPALEGSDFIEGVPASATALELQLGPDGGFMQRKGRFGGVQRARTRRSSSSAVTADPARTERCRGHSTSPAWRTRDRMRWGRRSAWTSWRRRHSCKQPGSRCYLEAVSTPSSRTAGVRRPFHRQAAFRREFDRDRGRRRFPDGAASSRRQSPSAPRRGDRAVSRRSLRPPNRRADLARGPAVGDRAPGAPARRAPRSSTTRTSTSAVWVCTPQPASFPPRSPTTSPIVCEPRHWPASRRCGSGVWPESTFSPMATSCS